MENMDTDLKCVECGADMSERKAFYDFQGDKVYCMNCYNRLKLQKPTKELYTKWGKEIKEIRELKQ